MKTVVLQSFRTQNVPAWMTRCMASVRDWAARRGYDYEILGDEIFALCGDDYLAAVGDDKRAITNLARLELVRMRLAADCERAIWLDADIFVFAPDRLTIDIETGYAFGREAWVWLDHAGRPQTRSSVHNAALVFTRGQPDLDFLIAAIRHIACTRKVGQSLQLGVGLLSGLQFSLRFPLLDGVGVFSPAVLEALAREDEVVLSALAAAQDAEIHAANLGWSQRDELGIDHLTLAMDRLEQTAGGVVNKHLPRGGSLAGSAPFPALPALSPPDGHFDSPAWLLRRAVRLVLPVLVLRRLRRLRDALRRRAG